MKLLISEDVVTTGKSSLETIEVLKSFGAEVIGVACIADRSDGSFPYPVLTPQIEDIMSKATAKFKNDPYVKEYYQTANEIQARENGLVEDDTLPPPAQAQQPQLGQPPLMQNDSTITTE